MYQHQKNSVHAGTDLQKAKKALIMLHGRGAGAEDIIGLSSQFELSDTAIVAPQATNNSWYPYSFMAPVENNQPALDSALELIGELVADILAAGIPAGQIYFLGFSQGACLTLEYVARNPQRYGGIVAFTGGLIGHNLDTSLYSGDFHNTPVLISTGDPDPHVPVSRVLETVSVLKALNAEVTYKVYVDRPHTISQQEIDLASELIFKSSNSKPV